MPEPTPPHRVEAPVMLQTWREVTFLHWRCEAAYLQPLLPDGLVVQLHDGSPWVGLTPFLLGVSPPGPASSVIRVEGVPETNLRTYVRGPDGNEGIWFFSLDLASAALAAAAKAAYQLPYTFGEMSVEAEGRRFTYSGRRLFPEGAAYSIEVLARGERTRKQTELEIFLTARWRLYTSAAGVLLEAPIEHEPWPLEDARVLHCEETLSAAAGLPPLDGRPLAHYSPGVDVRVGAPRPVTRAA